MLLSDCNALPYRGVFHCYLASYEKNNAILYCIVFQILAISDQLYIEVLLKKCYYQPAVIYLNSQQQSIIH